MAIERPTHEIAIAIVRRYDRWLVAKRRPEAHLGGLWEFPGGKCEKGEPPMAAAVRELWEECGVRAVAERVFLHVPVDYGDRICNLHAVMCRWESGEPVALASDACRWVSAEELREIEMPPVNARIVSEVLAMKRHRGG